MVQSFRDLTVWQKAMTLTERVYKATEKVAQADGRNLIEETSEVGRMLRGLLQSLTRPNETQG